MTVRCRGAHVGCVGPTTLYPPPRRPTSTAPATPGECRGRSARLDDADGVHGHRVRGSSGRERVREALVGSAAGEVRDALEAAGGVVEAVALADPGPVRARQLVVEPGHPVVECGVPVETLSTTVLVPLTRGSLAVSVQVITWPLSVYGGVVAWLVPAVVMEQAVVPVTAVQAGCAVGDCASAVSPPRARHERRAAPAAHVLRINPSLRGAVHSGPAAARSGSGAS